MANANSCRQLMIRLQQGARVNSLELKRALGQSWWGHYVDRCASMKGLRAEAKIARVRLGRYLKILRIADLRDAHPTPSSSNRRKIGRMRKKRTPAEWYEHALEVLSEMITEDRSLKDYLDRPFTPYDWSSVSNVGPDKDSVPRLIFSTRTDFGKNNPHATKSSRELKMEVLRAATEVRPH